METKKKRRRQDRKKETWREISGCDLGKLRVNIYFPSLGLSVVTWCLPTHTAAIQRCLSPPPLVFMVAWLALRHTATQYKHKMRYLHCGRANTQSQPHTFTHTYGHAQTDKIHVSRKSIPLLKDRLPAQLYPWLFCTFPLFCVYVCVRVSARVRASVNACAST